MPGFLPVEKKNHPLRSFFIYFFLFFQKLSTRSSFNSTSYGQKPPVFPFHTITSQARAILFFLFFLFFLFNARSLAFVRSFCSQFPSFTAVHSDIFTSSFFIAPSFSISTTSVRRPSFLILFSFSFLIFFFVLARPGISLLVAYHPSTHLPTSQVRADHAVVCCSCVSFSALSLLGNRIRGLIITCLVIARASMSAEAPPSRRLGYARMLIIAITLPLVVRDLSRSIHFVPPTCLS